MDTTSPEARSDTVDTLTAPTPLLPDAVLPASQSPHALGLWGRRLGQSDLQLFPLALGAGSFGWSVDASEAADLIDRFVDLGGNFIDATCSHPDARSEQVVGSWVGRRGRRGRILLGTTIGNHHDLSVEPAQVIIGAVDAALARLATDCLDLVSIQLDERSQVDEVLIAVDDLVRAGKVRQVTAAAPTADQLIAARVIAAQSGASPLVAVQANYNLLNRTGYEPEVARVVALQGSGFMPRQPLASGLLAGRPYSRQEVSRLKRRGLTTTLPPKRWPLLMGALSEVAGELGVSAAAVALAWLLTRQGVTAPILNVSRPVQVDGAMAAVRVQLTRQQTADLERLSGG